MTKDVIQKTRQRMEKVVEDLRRELAGVRTGRASISLLDHITVEYYGTPTPLNQVATLAVPEPTLITAQPWDAVSSGRDRKGHSLFGFRSESGQRWKDHSDSDSPAHRGTAKTAGKACRQGFRGSHTAIRNIRRDENEVFKKMLKEKQISEDEERKGSTKFRNSPTSWYRGLRSWLRRRKRRYSRFRWRRTAE